MYRLDLLGPVRLQHRAQNLPLPTQKIAALLALLALGGPTHRARLAGWLWPQGDDAGARRNLRRELARLRDAGHGDLLRSDGELLSLAVAPQLACDAWMLADAIDAAEQEPGNGARAVAALALWRGSPLDGMNLQASAEFDDWLVAERERLRRLRQRAVLTAARHHEHAGLPDSALSCLSALLAEEPLQEHLHREVMRLQLAAGRREAALAQYERCRAHLQSELGLSPTPATEALAAQARHPVQSARATDAPQRDPGDAGWAWLQAHWPNRQVLLLIGEAGSGKTRLAQAFAAAQGPYALLSCSASDAATPYASFGRLLRLLAGPSIVAAGLPTWVSAELAHLLPELGRVSQRQATAEDRSRLQAAALAAWQSLACGSFDSVLIDDWHLADVDSRALFRSLALAPPVADSPLLLMLLRPELDEELNASLQALRAAGAAELRLSAAPPRDDTDVAVRVQRLPMSTRQLLEAAALASAPFGADLLAAACAISEAEVLQTIEQALTAGLLREAGGGHAFASEPVKQLLLQDLPAARRRLVHRRLALGAEAVGLPPAEIARHWETGGEPRRAVDHRLAAAAQAVAVGSWDSAERHWQAALADEPSPAQHLAMLRQRWPTLQVRGDRDGLQAVVDTLEQLHERWQQQPASARAALEARAEQALMLGLSLHLHSEHEPLALADGVLAALADDDPLRPAVQLARAQALNSAGQFEAAEQTVEQTLARGSPGLTPTLQAKLLHTLVFSHFSRGQPQRALPFAQRTLQVWQAAGERRLTVRALANIGLMQSAIGDQVAAAAALREAREMAADLRLNDVHREICNNLADILLTEGDPAGALALTDEALALSDDWTRPDFRIYLGGMRVQACWQQGRLGEALAGAEQTLQLALAQARDIPLLDCLSMSLDVYSFVGDWAGADRLLAHLDERKGVRNPHFERKLAFNRVQLALARGDLAAAQAALIEVGPLANLHEQRDQEHAALCHGELALARGDADAALGWLNDWPAPRAHVEVAARRVLLALRAERQRAMAQGARRVGAAVTAAAVAEATSPQAPLPIRLQLMHALAADPDGDGAKWQTAFLACRDRLADSLHDWPMARDGLLRRWCQGQAG